MIGRIDARTLPYRIRAFPEAAEVLTVEALFAASTVMFPYNVLRYHDRYVGSSFLHLHALESENHPLRRRVFFKEEIAPYTPTPVHEDSMVTHI